MSDPYGNLTQAELLARALDALKRSDAGHALAYLKEAAGRPDASVQALFMLGSEYAQIGLVQEAKAQMARAVALGPDFPLARFQLGMLHVTSGEPEIATQVWAPLAGLGELHPHAYLMAFHRGMRHLVDDEFDAAVRALGEGLALNRVNEALNADMRRVIDAIEHLPGRQAASTSVEAPSSAPEPAERAEAEIEPGHLFISAYTHRGKPH